MNWRIIQTIFSKELLDTIRDRRTLLMMLGVPILLYPGIFLVGLQVALVQHDYLDRTVSMVALDTDDPDQLRAWLADTDKIEIVTPANPQAALLNGDVDLVVRTRTGAMDEIEEMGRVRVELLYDGTAFESMDASGRVQDALEVVAATLRDDRLKRAGIEPAYVEPLALKRLDVAPPEKTAGNLLGTVLPVLIVVMIALGAFYPAVDLTAGEKERGTFETLLSTPVTKLEIVTGKFLGVFLLAMCTGILNILSMAATAAFALWQLAPMLEHQAPLAVQLPLRALPIALLVMIPFGFFISAIMMSIAVFARSFKEAQNYVTPFFILITLPAMLAAMPGVELSATTQFVPIMNIVLLFRALLIGEVSIEGTFAVAISTTVFAMLALQFAAWIFQRDDVVLSEDRGAPLTLRRDHFKPATAPTPGLALSLYAFILLLLFYVGAFFQMVNPLVGVVITQWVLILLPTLGLLWLFRVNLRTALRLRRPTLTQAALALTAGAAALVLMLQVNVWHGRFLPVPEEMAQFFEGLFAEASTGRGRILLIFALALSPAICEELLFRGAILSGLARRMHPAAAILLVSLLFGIMHLSIYRLLPTALLGILLTWLAWRTASILPGMLVHLMVNGSAVLLALNAMPLWAQQVIDVERLAAEGLSWPVLFTAAVVLTASLGALSKTRRADPARFG